MFVNETEESKHDLYNSKKEICLSQHNNFAHNFRQALNDKKTIEFYNQSHNAPN